MTSESRSTMDDIFDLYPIPSVLLDPSLRIRKASKSFLDDLNLFLEECIGLGWFDLLKSQGLLREDCAREIQDAIEAASQTQRIQSVPHVAIGGDYGNVRVVPISKEGALLFFELEWHKVETPHREHKHNEIQGFNDGLTTTEAFRILVETVRDYAIFLLDTNGHVVTWNVGAELNKQYKREEIIGKHLSIFYGEEDLKVNKPKEELAKCLREGRHQSEGWRYRKDGSRFWANVSITTVYSNGVHVGFGKVTRDMTEPKAAESRLIAAYDESSKLKSQFLANMSHEIRTPMHGMLSANALLLETPSLTDEQRDLADIIDESGQVMLQVINDILDYSKLAAGSFSINSDIIDMASVLKSVARGFQATIRSDVHFELNLAPNLPKAVKGDRLRFRQVAQNIISNAGKFTEQGSIQLNSSVVGETEESYSILTEVIDTGIGIPELARRELFTPFTQFDNTTTKRYKGTGLGLSISRSLTELMGGQLSFAHNPVGHGSIFSFTVPFQKLPTQASELPEIEPQLSATSISTTSSTPDTDPTSLLKEIAADKHILLAEDNFINQRVMLKVLYSLNFSPKNITTVNDGDEAVRLIILTPEAYDLVLMDINMPRLDGFGATAAIRESGARVPICAMTANALTGNREECIEKGMDDYISKPVEREHLVKVLRKWLVGHMGEKERIGVDGVFDGDREI